MGARVINLTPTAVSQVDYEIAQGAALGAERLVWLSAEPSLLLGIGFLAADAATTPANFDYEAINGQLTKTLSGTVSKTSASAILTGTSTKFLTEVKPGDQIAVPGTAVELKTVLTIASDTSLTVDVAFANTGATQIATLYSGNPIVACVLTELKSDLGAAIVLGDLTATFTPAGYATDQNFYFPATRGVELVGPAVIANLITRATIPTVAQCKRGARFAFIQLPRLNTFKLVGATTQADITVPVRNSKSVAAGMDSSRWNKPGKTSEGSLKVMARDITEEDGLNRFKGLKCCAMIETRKEGTLTVLRQFCTNFVPGGQVSNPDQDEASHIDGSGNFQHMCSLVAA